MLGFYKHTKTGNIYFAESVVTNTTNSQDGQQLVLYYRCDLENAPLWLKPYVREYSEFLEEFTRVDR